MAIRFVALFALIAMILLSPVIIGCCLGSELWRVMRR